MTQKIGSIYLFECCDSHCAAYAGKVFKKLFKSTVLEMVYQVLERDTRSPEDRFASHDLRVADDYRCCRLLHNLLLAKF